jgi:hypothetical protein
LTAGSNTRKQWESVDAAIYQWAINQNASNAKKQQQEAMPGSKARNQREQSTGANEWQELMAGMTGASNSRD